VCYCPPTCVMSRFKSRESSRVRTRGDWRRVYSVPGRQRPRR
jgi:hypothetical protein